VQRFKSYHGHRENNAVRRYDTDSNNYNTTTTATATATTTTTTKLQQ